MTGSVTDIIGNHMYGLYKKHRKNTFCMYAWFGMFGQLQKSQT